MRRLNTAEDGLEPIPLSFEEGEEYSKAFAPCFHAEVKADIEKSLREIDLYRASCVQLCVYTEKSGCLYLSPGANRDNRPVFQLSFKQDDFVLFLPAASPLPNTVKELLATPHFLGTCEHDVKNGCKQALMLIRTSRDNQVFEAVSGGNSYFYVAYVESLITILREYRMLQLAEFLPLSPYLLQPKLKPTGGALSIPKSYMARTQALFNESQFNAIAYACSREDGFTLIQGPPGTGKTHTIVGLISAFLAAEGQGESRVLVCAPSNAAIDEIAQRVVRKGIIGSNGDIQRDIPLVRLGNWRQEHLEIKQRHSQKDAPQEVQQISLSALVGKRLQAEGKHDQPEIVSDLRKQLEQVERGLKAAKERGDKRSQVDLVEKQRTVQAALTREKHLKYSMEEKRKSLEGEILQQARVIFATLSGAGSKDIEKAQHGFDYVIIDEAGQAVELSGLIPLQYNAKHVVLVGDPRQLPATTFSLAADKAGYSRSLFERFEQAGCGTFVLTIQYRMVPDIRAFPSGYFYGNFLQDDPSILSRPKAAWLSLPPVLFINLTTSRESRTADDTSICNKPEAEFLVSLFEHYGQWQGRGMDIGLISPYKKQVRLVRSLLGNRDRRDIEVNTVDGFQGREKEAIFFSCVRSGDHIGFLSDMRRLNVAITRARSCLVIVGAEATLIQHDCWREFILYLKKNGLAMTCKGFEEVQGAFKKTELPQGRTLVTEAPNSRPSAAHPGLDVRK